jgi:hypothetical protein
MNARDGRNFLWNGETGFTLLDTASTLDIYIVSAVFFDLARRNGSLLKEAARLTSLASPAGMRR